MKKKMVTMLMLGVMAVMTACGSGEKADTTKETADSQTAAFGIQHKDTTDLQTADSKISQNTAAKGAGER